MSLLKALQDLDNAETAFSEAYKKWNEDYMKPRESSQNIPFPKTESENYERAKTMARNELLDLLQ